MLHELLLALYGIPGAIFVESPKNRREAVEIMELDSYIVPISETLPFVSQAELGLNEELLKLGSYYKYLERFIRSHGGPYQGLYLASIAFGIDNALKNYRKSLQSLESEALSDPNLGLSYFSYKLHPYKAILPVLTRIVRNVEKSISSADSDSIHSSCCLLDILLAAVPKGLPSLRFITQKILAHSLQVFYRQLSCWLIHGVLHDPHGEFFIQIQNESTNDTSTESIINELDKPRPVSFTINTDNIPSFLPSTFAHRVLFTGQTVHRTTHDPSKSSFLLDLERIYSPKFGQLTDLLNKFIDRQDYEQLEFDAVLDVTALQGLISDVQHFVSHSSWSSLMQEHNLLEYLRSVKDVFLLGRGELFLAFIDQLNRLNSSVGESRPSVVHPQYNIRNQCGFLDRPLPRDENEARALEYDIAEAFLLAARFVGLDDEELDSRFRFSVSQTPVDADYLNNTEPTLWDCIQLRLIVPPSLKCLFSRQVCRAYNRLFRYLFTIRCTQVELQRYWANQTVQWRHRFAANLFHSSNSENQIKNQSLDKATLAEMQSCVDRRLLVRNYMAFIVENLQYYLQVDVIESQFCHLVDRIQTDQEVELVQVAHEACLAALQAQALLFLPETKQCILQLLTVCRRFVLITSQNQSEFQISPMEERLIREFQQLSKKLFECLNSSSATGAKSSISLESGSRRFERTKVMGTADLSQLLLRLDFNHFYSESDGLLKTG